MKQFLKRSLILVLVAVLSFFIFTPSAPRSGLQIYKSGVEVTMPCSTYTSSEDVKIGSRFLELILGKEEKEDQTVLLIPGGGIFGAKIKQSYVTVQNPGEVRELKVGDKILSLNGKAVTSVSDVKKYAQDIKSGELSIACERSGKHFTVVLKPQEIDGEYKLGIVLKDGTAGIGTITYIDPKTGSFGGLGHGICDTDTGEVIPLTTGEVTGVVLSGVKKGEEGKPGELSGILTDKVSGTIYANTECGVFGKLYSIPEGASVTPIKIAHRDEVHEGEATIISSVKIGAPKEFKIKITNINKSSTGTKSFRIEILDPTLLAITGGVVRGMSGSPVIQDGKLVGAVTHVLVANPTEGYGIFIENMLSASESARNELPKSA